MKDTVNINGTMAKTLLQVTVVLFTGILLLGCPIDEEDIFSGDVEVTNNTASPAADIDFISIEEADGATGADLLGGLLLPSGSTSATFTGYDCITSYTVSTRIVGTATIAPSTPFTPPCGGIKTVPVTN